MRKGAKIKSSVFLLAWTTIFAHGVIPHSHSEDFCTSSCSGIHVSLAGNKGVSENARLLSFPADGKVCHLSSLLFQNFNPENLFPVNPGEIIFIPSCNAGKIYIQSGISLISLHIYPSVSLRAPPLA